MNQISNITHLTPTKVKRHTFLSQPHYSKNQYLFNVTILYLCVNIYTLSSKLTLPLFLDLNFDWSRFLFKLYYIIITAIYPNIQKVWHNNASNSRITNVYIPSESCAQLHDRFTVSSTRHAIATLHWNEMVFHTTTRFIRIQEKWDKENSFNVNFISI